MSLDHLGTALPVALGYLPLTRSSLRTSATVHRLMMCELDSSTHPLSRIGVPRIGPVKVAYWCQRATTGALHPCVKRKVLP